MKLRGGVTINLRVEERAFLIKSFKKIKGKTELENRIIKRTLMRLMGRQVGMYPLFPNKECKLCERTYSYTHYEAHVIACKRRRQQIDLEVDPEILRRIELE